MTMTSKHSNRFKELLEKDVNIILVEDGGNSIGRSLTLGASISHLLDQQDLLVLSSEISHRVQEAFKGTKTFHLNTYEDAFEMIECEQSLIILHSLTPLLVNSSPHQIARFFRKHLFSKFKDSMNYENKFFFIFFRKNS